MKFDPLDYPHPSRRHLVYSTNGMVATQQPLAAQAGLRILEKGGNAIDSAVATAASLTVLDPTSNGIGGDAFAVVWHDGDLHGLNASGPAPASLSIEEVRSRGYDEMPEFGWEPVTVPGAPAAWSELSKRFGKLPLSTVLGPAIEYAEEGFPVPPTVGKTWEKSFDRYREMDGEEFDEWKKTFGVNGKPPGIGEVWASPDHAKTLHAIGETGGDSFYRGGIAERICEHAEVTDGFLAPEDLAGYSPTWADPISTGYRGYTVWEMPPNGQGVIVLMALNILRGLEVDPGDAVDRYHKQIEALKLAFADGYKYVSDPDYMSVGVEELLSAGYARGRRKLIQGTASYPKPGTPPSGGDTVYLAAADGEGNMVSFIQSNYRGFGSGIVVPETGIALQNRGALFSLDPDHDNCLSPGKKPYHTIIPGFLTKDRRPVGPFGVMGGFMQPQGHIQVVTDMIDLGLNPQSALDAPRWRWIRGKQVKLESSTPDHIARALARKGHNPECALDSTPFGKGQIIVNEDGVLVGGTEPRCDGQVAAY